MVESSGGGLRRALGALALLAGVVVVAGCHEYRIEARFGPGEIDIFDDLYSVSVVDDRHAVAVGYWGAVYITEDGGLTWSKGDSGTRRSLYGVAMPTPQKGWVVGQRGLVMRTEDGGRTWTEQKLGVGAEGAHLFAITAIDENTAWIVGEWGTRVYTTDGGRTWEDHSLTIDEQHPQFVWLSPPEQERVRAGEKVYEDVTLTDVYCLARPSRDCWIIGEFGYLFWSQDGGASWTRATIQGSGELPPIEMGYNEVSLTEADKERVTKFALEVASQQHLNIAVEPLASDEEIARMGNPKDPWELFSLLESRSSEVRVILEEAGILPDRLRMRGTPPWDYEDFIEDDPDFLKRYFDRRRAKKGGVEVVVVQNPYLFTVRFQDPTNGIVAGLGGVMLVSRDGGKTWQYRRIDRTQALFAVDAVDGRAVAVGEKGLVRVSVDGGDTWAPPQPGTFPPVFTFMRDIDFAPDGKLGLIVGQRGRIYRTEDAGFLWKQVLPPADRRPETGEGG
jgi:photosystem II stability/assembly factor-like uncharacterized protein